MPRSQRSSDTLRGPCGFFHSDSPSSSKSSAGLESLIMRWYFSISFFASCASPGRLKKAAARTTASRFTSGDRRLGAVALAAVVEPRDLELVAGFRALQAERE